MTDSINRIWQTAVWEWFSSLRSKRAVATVVIFIASSMLSVYLSLSALAKVEESLAEVLRLPKTEETGVVSGALWKSESFQRIARHAISDSAVYDDICGKHPAELIYAWFAFLYLPVLVVLMCANRVADDVRSGTVRYMLTRVTRLEWTIGKYIGQALLILPGMVLGAVAAWAVMMTRLSGTDAASIAPSLIWWSVKAWFFALAWLGVVTGISHLTSSGAKATVLAVGALMAAGIMPHLMNYLSRRFGLPLTHFTVLFPGEHTDGLWRTSFMPVFCSICWQVVLGWFYLLAGHFFFARKDVR